MKPTNLNSIFVSLAVMLLSTTSVITAHADVIEIDSYPSITGIPLGLSNGTTSETLSLDGIVTWEVTFPDILGSAVDSDTNGLEDVPATMTQFDLMGLSTMGLVQITLNTAVNSTGMIEEQVNNTPNRLDVAPFEVGSADAYFDLFIVLTIGSTVVHNNTALRISGPWSEKPPPSDELLAMFLDFGHVVLFDDGELPTYILVDPDTDGSDPDVIAAVVAALPVGVFANRGDPEGQRNAVLSRLADIEQDIFDGDIAGAIRALQNLLRHVNGCPPSADRNDWITSCPAQIVIRGLIETLILNLSTP
jgi:hypothetical protein